MTIKPEPRTLKSLNLRGISHGLEEVVHIYPYRDGWWVLMIDRNRSWIMWSGGDFELSSDHKNERPKFATI